MKGETMSSDEFVGFDAALYLRLPKSDTLSALAMLRKMLLILPKETTPAVKSAGREARTAGEALRVAYNASLVVAEGEGSLMPLDNHADGVLYAIDRRLEDYERLVDDAPELAEEARSLRKTLYPASTDFARFSPDRQWTATEEWFARLAEEGREAALGRLVGTAFVEALRTVHAEYGQRLGMTEAKPAKAAKVDLATPLRACLEAMSDLALQLVAVVGDKRATVEARRGAREALRPIDEARASNQARTARKAARASAAEETKPVSEPLPDLSV